VVVVLAGLWLVRGGAQAPADVISGASNWVEFSAVMTKNEPGRPDSVGRFFRGADGSDRLESGPSLDDVRGIAIHNFATEHYYMWANNGQGWHGFPMPLGRDGKRPQKLRANLATPTPQPLTHEGLAVVQVMAGAWTVRKAPDLNFFDVDKLAPNGARVVASNIRRARLDDAIAALPPTHAARYANLPSLFDPPAGVPVTWHTEPNGIIVKELKK